MKRLITLLVMVAALGMNAQQKLAQRVNELKVAKETFHPYSVLTVSSEISDSDVKKTVSDATLAKIQMDKVNDIYDKAYDAIELEIPFRGTTVTLELYKVKILHDDFHLDTDQGRFLPYEPGVHYRGIIKGNGASLAAMNFFEGEFNGIISDQNLNNVVVSKLDKPGNTTDYIVYSDADMLIQNLSGCIVAEEDSDKGPQEMSNQTESVQSARCATIYFELDYQIYTQNQSNAVTANNWMASVFNNIQTLYENDGISISMKNVFVWTTPDPYSGTTSTAYLNAFRQYRPVFDGDLGQLIGIDPGGLGGVAAAVAGICGTANAAYADVDFGFNSVPTYSWTVQVITHELGHLMGSPHTHSCAWNGNNTPIDNCGPAAIPNSEGTGCMSSPAILPSTTVKGTIMSYCHLLGAIGINLSNGFGIQPRQRILSILNGATCLSTDCVSTCINTAVNMRASEVTANSAVLNWDDIGATGTWQASVSTLSGSGSWTSVSDATFTANNLQPNTYYKLRLKPSCVNGMTSNFRQLIFATGADWCSGSGVTITDTGGTSGYYGNDQDFVRVIIPTQANKKIKMTFTSFATENNYDKVWVFNGSSTAAPAMGNANGFSGTTNPGTFTSSAADGALTLRFMSDSSNTAAGFAANIVCEASLGTGDFSPNIDFTYYPNPTSGQVNIMSQSTTMSKVEVFNISGQRLLSKQLNGMETQVDISQFPTGAYFFKLQFDGAEANFKILKK